MTEPLHKQSYDKFVKRISNMQQLTSNFLKKCAFRPHSRAEPGLHAPRAIIFIFFKFVRPFGAQGPIFIDLLMTQSATAAWNIFRHFQKR